MVPLVLNTTPPAELRAYTSQNPQAGPQEFENDSAFQAAKSAVKAKRNFDQGGLCIYCERSIGPQDGHVEHLHPKRGPDADAAQTFVYANLVQSCMGTQSGEKRRHCGDAKGSQLLVLLPTSGCNDHFVLQTDGTIKANRVGPPGIISAEELDRQTDDILRLNLPALKRERSKRMDSFREILPNERAAYLAQQPFRHILERT